MMSRLAISKVHSILLGSLIIVSLGTVGYYYHTQPAEFQVANLTVYPLKAAIGQPVAISANVTNIGDEAGNYSLDLNINDIAGDKKTIALSGGESEIVMFLVTEIAEGNYSVRVADLNGTFTTAASTAPSTLILSDLNIEPTEAWPTDPVTISVNASNIGADNIDYWLAFKVNNVPVESKQVKLSGGSKASIALTVNETSVATYRVDVGDLNGSFKVVPTGKHTLSVIANTHGISFTINGVSHVTQYSALMDVGNYTIIFPTQFTNRVSSFSAADQLEFMQWEDGAENNTRTVNLQTAKMVVAYYNKEKC